MLGMLLGYSVSELQRDCGRRTMPYSLRQCG